MWYPSMSLRSFALFLPAPGGRISCNPMYSKMVTMLRTDTPDIGDGHAATEAKLLRRFRELVTYCLDPRLPPELLQCVLDSIDVEITLFKGVINWAQSRIILLFNRQMKPGESTHTDLFPLEQVTLWALQIALTIAIRSNTPEHLLIHFCPLTRYETTSSGLSSLQDIPEEACIVRVTAQATGDSSNTDRTLSSHSDRAWPREARWG